MSDRSDGSPGADRPGLAGGARLAAALPLYLVGLGTMTASVAARGLFVGAAVGLLLAGVAAASVPGPLPAVGYAAVAVLVGGLAFLGFVGRARRVVRTRLRLQPAALLLRAHSPGTDPERRAAETLARLARGVDLPVPALRVLPDDRPACFTVGYHGDDPPAALIERTLGVEFQREGGEDGAPTASAFADAVDADHVVVVSTGLLSALSARELEAVLAHEVAHLRNGDPRLYNWLLLPVGWAESAIRAATDADRGRRVLTALRGGAKLFALAVTLPAVAVLARGREYAADRGGAAITGDPAALASALSAVADDAGASPVSDLRSAAVLDFVPTDRRGITHPPTERRIERLRKLARRQSA